LTGLQNARHALVYALRTDGDVVIQGLRPPMAWAGGVAKPDSDLGIIYRSQVALSHPEFQNAMEFTRVLSVESVKTMLPRLDGAVVAMKPFIQKAMTLHFNAFQALQSFSHLFFFRNDRLMIADALKMYSEELAHRHSRIADYTAKQGEPVRLVYDRIPDGCNWIMVSETVTEL
jgi:hypothetical protein